MTNPPKQTKPLKPLSLKDKLFLKNLKQDKLNQTQAYLDTYPKSQYKSANANGNRKLNKIVKDGKVSISELVDKSNDIIKQLYTDTSVKIEKKADIAVQLTKRQVTDKQEVATQLTPDLEQAIDNYKPTNRLEQKLKQDEILSMHQDKHNELKIE